MSRIRGAQADPGLREDLAELVGDTTDDLGPLRRLQPDAARMWARLRIHLAETGRRVRINDLWIAAIAASRGLPVVTQDGDFDALESVSGLTVVRL